MIVPRSLAARLVLSAGVFSLVALVIGAAFLTALYRGAVYRTLDEELGAVVASLISVVGADEAGEPSLQNRPVDPRFDLFFSGRYWQVQSTPPGGGNRVIDRSRSLWDYEIVWPMPDGDGRPGPRLALVDGPDGQRLRAVARQVRVAGMDQPILVVAAADTAPVAGAVRRFALTLALALVTLAATLIGSLLVQVRIGLKPLREMRAELAAIAQGRRVRLRSDYPEELQELALEVNELLDHNEQVVDRARTHVGNLAHALKTPISVLRNEARSGGSVSAELVERQAGLMAGHVDHYLKRAGAAARAEALGARADVGEAAADIVRTLSRLYRQVDMDVEIDESGPLIFRGERQDLDEMLGNLAENACKYGGGAVRVSARRARGKIEVAIEDNGPGLSEDERAQALKRGARLDENAPGAGLGLSIVSDFADMYGGELRLERSELGGLKATLALPAAA